MAFLQNKICQTLLMAQRLPRLSMVRLQSTGVLQRTRRCLFYDIHRFMSNDTKETKEMQKRPLPQRPEMTTGWHTTRTQVDELIDLYRNTPEDPKIEVRRRKQLAMTVLTIAAGYATIIIVFVSLYLYFAYFPI